MTDQNSAVSWWQNLQQHKFYIRYWLGNSLTLAILFYIEFNRQHHHPVIAPFALLMLTIVISTSTGGLRLGLITSTIVSGYTLFSYFVSFGPMTLTGNLLNTIIGIIIFYAQATILGLIKQRADTTIIQLEETRLELHKEVEDQEEKLQDALEKALVNERGNALGKFATGISHDFNNLLQAIMSLSELAQLERDDPEKIGVYLDDIIRQSVLGSKLIQQIMDFSRKSKIITEEVHLNSFLQEFIENSRRIIPKRIELEYHGISTDLWVTLDPTHLNQILLNIISNAKDAITNDGKIDVFLETDELHHLAVLIVRDTGSGMSQDTLSHVFEPYFTTKSRSEGSGLGLAQVWGLVQQYGGEIDVTSTPKQGSIFTIKLPII